MTGRWLFTAAVLAILAGCGEDGASKEGAGEPSGDRAASGEGRPTSLEEQPFREEWFWSDRLNEPPPSAATLGEGEASPELPELLERVATTPLVESAELLEQIEAQGESARAPLCRAIEESLAAETPDADRRYRLLTALARVNGPEAAPTLCRLLRDELPETSALAAELLGSCEAPWVVPRLLKTFGKWDNSRSILTRVMAIEALTRYGVYSGIPHLLALLAENTAREVPDTERNWERTTRMAWFKDEIERVLISVSGEDFGFDSGQGAAAMAESVGRWLSWWDEHSDEYLMGERTPHSIEDAALREQIDRLMQVGFTAYQLRNVDNARWLLEHLGPMAVPQLIEGLSDPELFVRVHSAEVLGRIGDARAREPFRQRLGIEEAAPARALLVSSLGVVGGAEDIELLLGLAREESEPMTVRVAAILAVGEIGAAKGLEAVQRIADREPVDELTIAAWAVEAKHGDDAAFEALLTQLASDTINDRARGSTALTETFHEDFGFDPYASSEERQKSIDAWREWWKERRSGQ